MRHLIHETNMEQARGDYPDKMVNKTRLWGWDYEDKIVFRESTQYTGLNHHSQKRWFRWQSGNCWVVKRGARGQYVPLHRTSTGRFYGGWVAHNSIMSITRPNARRTMGANSQFWDIYDDFVDDDTFKPAQWPLYNEWLVVPEARGNGLAAGTFDIVQNANLAEMTKAMFGKKRYRKDLVKAVGGTSPSVAVFASRLRSDVPVDWLINFMRGVPRLRQDGMVREYLPPQAEIGKMLVKVVRDLDPRSLRPLLRDTDFFGSIGHYIHIVDIARYGGPNSAGRYFNSWQSLHDSIGRRNGYAQGGYIRADILRPARAYTPPPPIIFEKRSEISMRIHSIFEKLGGDYTHVLPEGSEMLQQWSDYMGNCISGYKHSVQSLATNVGAVYYQGKMIANYEVDKQGIIRQVYGRFNKVLPSEQDKFIRNILKLAGAKENKFTYTNDNFGIDLDVLLDVDNVIRPRVLDNRLPF